MFVEKRSAPDGYRGEVQQTILRVPDRRVATPADRKLLGALALQGLAMLLILAVPPATFYGIKLVLDTLPDLDAADFTALWRTMMLLFFGATAVTAVLVKGFERSWDRMRILLKRYRSRREQSFVLEKGRLVGDSARSRILTTEKHKVQGRFEVRVETEAGVRQVQDLSREEANAVLDHLRRLTAD